MAIAKKCHSDRCAVPATVTLTVILSILWNTDSITDSVMSSNMDCVMFVSTDKICINNNTSINNTSIVSITINVEYLLSTIRNCDIFKSSKLKEPRYVLLPI